MAKYSNVPIKVQDYVNNNDLRNDFFQIDINDNQFESYYVDIHRNIINLGISNRSATHFISVVDAPPTDPLYPVLTDFVSYMDSTDLDNSLFYFTGTTDSTDKPKVIIQRIGGKDTVMYTETLPTIYGTVTFDITDDVGLNAGERIKVTVKSDVSAPNPWSIEIEGEATGPAVLIGKVNKTVIGSNRAIVNGPDNSPASISDIVLSNNGIPYHFNNFIQISGPTVQEFKYSDYLDSIGEIYAGNKFTLSFYGDPAHAI